MIAPMDLPCPCILPSVLPKDTQGSRSGGQWSVWGGDDEDAGEVLWMSEKTGEAQPRITSKDDDPGGSFRCLPKII